MLKHVLPKSFENNYFSVELRTEPKNPYFYKKHFPKKFMKKQVPIFASILILLTGIISAYSYNPSSLGNALDTLGGENIGLLIVFLGSFALISVILNRTKFFEENRGASTIISLMLTIGITYFGFYKSGMSLDVAGLFYGLGFSEMALDLVVFFVTAGLCILLLVKFKSNALLVLGGFMLALTITGVAPGEGILFIGGIGLLIIWGVVMLMKHGKRRLDQRVYLKDITRRR